MVRKVIKKKKKNFLKIIKNKTTALDPHPLPHWHENLMGSFLAHAPSHYKVFCKLKYADKQKFKQTDTGENITSMVHVKISCIALE